MKKILAIGTILEETQYIVSNIPKSGDVSLAFETKSLTSSKIINSARILAAKSTVNYSGFVGIDGAGTKAIYNLKNYKLNTDLITTVNKPTGKVLVQTKLGEAPAITIFLGANNDLDKVDKHLSINVLKDYDYIYTATSVPPKALYKMFNMAKKANIPILLDMPNRLEEIDKSKFENIAYLMPNRQEAQILLSKKIQTLTDAKNAAFKLRAFTKGSVVITLDKDGAVAFLKNDSQPKFFPTLEVRNGDSAGAGDIFRGVFLSEILNENSITNSLKKAIILATKSVYIKGVDESIKHTLKLM